MNKNFDNSNKKKSAIGTNAIHRNRVGPMIRGGKKESYVSSENRGRHRRGGVDGGSNRPIRNIEHPIQQCNQFSSPRQKYLFQTLSTHVDQDDTEILIESALGGNNYSAAQYLKPKNSRSAHRGGKKAHGIRSSILNASSKRSYSPLKGRDIFTEEEMNFFTTPTPESIFEIPPNWKKHKRIVLRILFVIVGMLMYFIIVTTSNIGNNHGKFEENAMKLDTATIETDIDINQITSSNVFNYDKNAMDLGPGDGEDIVSDDMVNEDALQKVKLSKIVKVAGEQKEGNASLNQTNLEDYAGSDGMDKSKTQLETNQQNLEAKSIALETATTSLNDIDYDGINITNTNWKGTQVSEQTIASNSTLSNRTSIPPQQ